MRLPRYYRKLQNLCRGWGGDLIMVPLASLQPWIGNDSSFDVCPFHSRMGIRWNTKCVYIAADPQPLRSPPAGDVIHEMSHIFASTGRPSQSKEWTWFGWEYAVARHIGVPWKEWAASQSEYEIGVFKLPFGDVEISGPFGMLLKKQQKAVMADRWKAAKTTGLVSLDGTPLTIR